MIYEKVLAAAAVCGQLLSLFPCAVLFNALGLGKYSIPAYFIIYAAWVIFYAAGCFAGKTSDRFSGKGAANVAAKLAVILPSAIFIVIIQLCGFTPATYLYVLTAGIVIYFGGFFTVGKNYSGKFTPVWFILNLALSLVSAFLLNLTKDPVLVSDGTMQLCGGFAVMVIFSAVLLNQSAIDARTKQRASGKILLPSGLRGFNVSIVLVISVLSMGLFLFAKPVSQVLLAILKIIGTGIFYVVKAVTILILGNEAPEEGTQQKEYNMFGNMSENEVPQSHPEIIMAVLIALAVIILIVFRKQIMEVAKGLFSSLAKKRSQEEELPYCDELGKSDVKSPRLIRKMRRETVKLYEKETEPITKYRLGYKVYLSKLQEAGCGLNISDTTTVHAKDGEDVFGDYGSEICEQREVYNRVRYGGEIPTAEELDRQKKMISEIKPGKKRERQ